LNFCHAKSPANQQQMFFFFRRRSKIDHVSLGGLGGVGGAEGFLRDEIERQVNPKVWIDMCTQKLYVYFLFEHSII